MTEEKIELTNRDVFEKIFGFRSTPAKKWWDQEADLTKVLTTLAKSVAELVLIKHGLKKMDEE